MDTPHASRRWWALATIGIGELLVTLDNSIVNIALPSAQAGLHFADDQRSWVITAYALAFGSLLLLGGRLSDVIGRRRAFLTGSLGFALSSLLGGLAPDFTLLVAARAAQGAFAALLAPAALALLATIFPSGPDRARAFGIFSALAVCGGALGLILGGALTQFVSWRACLFVAIVFAIPSIIGAGILLPRSAASTHARVDALGTAAAASGLFLLVWGLSNAETSAWISWQVTGPLALGIIALSAFVLIQRRTAHPLLPLRIVLDRFRAGAFITGFVTIIGMFGVYLFLTYVMQRQFGFSPTATGAAFLPMIAGLMVGATQAPIRLLPRVGPRALLAGGLVVCAGALSWLSLLSPGSTYGTGVVGPLIIMGLGMGTAISTVFSTATAATAPEDAGVTSATVNVVQQVGGSVGIALLASVAGSATASAQRMTAQAAALHGYATGFLVAAAIFVATAVLVALLVPRDRPALPADDAEIALQEA
jgi:EmrB/QacA subfamily drug resistance transporter